MNVMAGLGMLIVMSLFMLLVIVPQHEDDE